mmetsp:Transcript_41629/g.163508  ORF Transcript_41629/g.163508 Transcript_41629/m.163508 type:complete len:85 (+) Transcript_41629:258-512(+)
MNLEKMNFLTDLGNMLLHRYFKEMRYRSESSARVPRRKADAAINVWQIWCDPLPAGSRDALLATVLPSVPPPAAFFRGHERLFS